MTDARTRKPRTTRSNTEAPPAPKPSFTLSHACFDVRWLENEIHRVEGVVVAFRFKPDRNIIIPLDRNAAYAAAPGQRNVQPAKTGDTTAVRARRIQTIVNRIQNMRLGLGFTIHDPADPLGWERRREIAD